MAFTVQNVLDEARWTLNDGIPTGTYLAVGTRWPDNELLVYYNAAMDAAVGLRPDLFNPIGDIPLVAGVDQSLPAGGVVLIDIYSIKNGAAVNRTDIDTIRTFVPSYRTYPSGPCQNWWFPPQDVQIDRGPLFQVFPPSPVGQVLTGQFVKSPVAVLAGNTGSAVPIPDIYQSALAFYVIARSQTKDDEAVMDGLTAASYGIFKEMFAVADQTESVAP